VAADDNLPPETALGTDALTAAPEQVVEMPSPSITPLVLAVGITGVCVGVLLEQVWLLVPFALLIVVAFFAWHWPARPEPTEPAEPAQPVIPASQPSLAVDGAQ
jgi:hypothetical protein